MKQFSKYMKAKNDEKNTNETESETAEAKDNLKASICVEVYSTESLCNK
jgi:hypothetical protein